MEDIMIISDTLFKLINIICIMGIFLGGFIVYTSEDERKKENLKFV